MTRIVAWNCAGKFSRNAAALAALDADICIVPEALEGHADALGANYSVHWHGDEGQRGLLIAAKRDWRIEVVQAAPQRHMALTTLQGPTTSLSVIGVWAMRGPKGCTGAVIDGLDTLLPLAAASPNVFVAGDFNASPVFDSSSPPALRFAEISGRLQDAGLVSLWHDRAGEAFGAESCATYHHQWKQEQPFHIDFAFASKALAARCRHFEIGKFDPWCQSSDHVPLVADFD
ncbi:MAG: endonuclease/exonuclease/phosphatase family protein [Hyphomonadaceae bacterium]|nr:endonuclease/exonuclease/phosphatase family protein [Hyphomonadaceae bacterium]